MKCSLGLDIGTTSICAVAIQAGGAPLFCRTLSNTSGAPVQDPLKIWEICTKLPILGKKILIWQPRQWHSANFASQSVVI